MRAHPSVRAVLAWLVMSASVVTFALVSAPQADAATASTYTATSTVNVRSSQSNSGIVVGQVAKGKHVLASGKVKSGWLPIKFNGKTAYIATKYLKRDAKTASVVITGPAGKKTSIMSVPIRTKAKVSATALKVAPKGTVLQVTGETSGIYSKVTIANVQGWASTRRLSAQTIVLPDVVANYVTTAPLALRVSDLGTSTSQVTIPIGATVGGSGVHSGGYSQVVYSEKVGWVITGYLQAVADTPAALVLPLRATTVYATAALSILQKPAADAPVVGTATLGTALRGTGATQDGYVAVIWNGTIAWVSKAAATVSLGSTSLDKLESFGKAAVIEMRAAFPQLTSIYGWRASSAYSSDHPNGRAADFMIPSYKLNKALGDAVAAYVIANGQRLHVTYLIWQQRSYTLTRGTWKAMEDRGGDTANHMDHVHVSFEPSPK
jgi:uncharacterized protein YgiM (DUF1202 family)